MIRATITALLLASSAAAFAQTGDSRLVEHLYDPHEVVTIEGKPRVQATIAFEDDEAIENVAIGDSSAWQVTPNKRANLLFVKPLTDRAATNMTVVTDRRTYLFDLVAKPDAQAIYVLRFTFPEPPEAEKALASAASAVEMAAATDPYAVSDPAALNFAWKRAGAAKLYPAQAYDNGIATFLTWADGMPIPAILVKDQEGTEGPVNFAVRDDTIVVDGVPREIILRSGDDVASIVNEGPIRSVSDPGDGSLAMNRGTN
jgi:type IV secretion system protein VirB9